MSAFDVKEIVYHCQCRRFMPAVVAKTCICHECGRQHAPDDVHAGTRAVSGF